MLAMGLIAGISLYFIIHNSVTDDVRDDSTMKIPVGIPRSNCEAENNAECLDMVCNKKCSQCKNYRVSTNAVAKINEKYANETCVLSEDRKCVLEGWCQAEFRIGSRYIGLLL